MNTLKTQSLSKLPHHSSGAPVEALNEHITIPHSHGFPIESKERKTFIENYKQQCIDNFTKLFNQPVSSFFNDDFKEERRAVMRCRMAKDLRKMRKDLRDYGIDKFKDDLVSVGILEPNTYHIATSQNIFAKIVTGQIIPSYGDCKDHPHFFFAPNLKENDDHVHDGTLQWLGKASCSEIHKFIIPRDLTDWTFMNGLTLGIRSPADAQRAIKMLEEMKQYAIQKIGKPEEDMGFFLHIYPFNSIHLLHLHAIDIKRTGPTYTEMSFKNFMLGVMLEVLREEAGV
jgi:hypothetical protein